MSADEDIVRKFIHEAFNEGRLEAIDDMTTPAFVEHQDLGPNPPQGRDGPKAVVSSLRRAFSDFHLAVEDAASRDGTVWLRMRATGTHDGPFMGRAPTGKRISVTVIDVLRVADGKIIEHWGVADRLGVLSQIDGQVRAG